MLVAVVVSVFAFVMLVAIGNPVRIMLGETASPEQVAELTTALGLDQPIHVQYVRFVQRIVTRGEFGRSFYYGQDAMRLILERMPATLLLSIPPIVLGALFSIPLGVLAALRRGTNVDRAILAFSMLGISTPSFWFAVVLVQVFAVSLRWLPSSGYGRPEHLVLPIAALTLSTTAILVRLVRTEMLETMGRDFVRTATAKGLSARAAVLRHTLRNSLIPFVTILGLMTGNVLGNSVITERIFAWPGSGRLLLTSIERLDQPVVVAFVVLVALLFVTINTLVDVLYFALDPRIRYG